MRKVVTMFTYSKVPFSYSIVLFVIEVDSLVHHLKGPIMALAWKIDAGTRVNLKDYDPNHTDKRADRAAADQELLKLSDELSELQELLAAAQQHSLLMVLQGMDTSGK